MEHFDDLPPSVVNAVEACVRKSLKKRQAVSVQDCIDWVRREVPGSSLSDSALIDIIVRAAIDRKWPIDFDSWIEG